MYRISPVNFLMLRKECHALISLIRLAWYRLWNDLQIHQWMLHLLHCPGIWAFRICLQHWSRSTFVTQILTFTELAVAVRNKLYVCGMVESDLISPENATHGHLHCDGRRSVWNFPQILYFLLFILLTCFWIYILRSYGEPGSLLCRYVDT